MDLNTVLIILGVLALVILVAHGLWANRREKTQFFKNANTFTRDGRIERGQQGLENDPLTGVPVQQASQLHGAQTRYEPAAQSEKLALQTESQPQQQSLDFERQQPETRHVPLYDSPVSSPKSVEQAVKQIKISLPGEPEQSESDEREAAETDKHADHEHSLLKNGLEPLTYSDPNPIFMPEEVVDDAQPAPSSDEAQFVLLYVVAPERREFNGANLALALEELGFIYSEDGIFNRHMDTVATPVLYSVANIRDPGTFELATMADFSTVGVVFFMEISAQPKDRVNFLCMSQDAARLAERLGGFVLDENQEIFSDSTKARYIARLSR